MDSQLPNKNGFLINDLTIICKCEITISNYDNEGEEPTIRPPSWTWKTRNELKDGVR